METKSNEITKKVLYFLILRLMDIESFLWFLADITVFPFAWLRRYLSFILSNLK